MELRQGEHELYEGRPSWRALMSFYLIGIGVAVVALVVFGLLADSWPLAVVVAVVIAGGTLIAGYLRRISTKYLITTQRLRISRGIIKRNVQETRLERVQNVNYEQGVLDRLLHVGTVDFDTAGTDDSEFRFEWVNGPEQVVRAVDRAMEAARCPARPPPRRPSCNTCSHRTRPSSACCRRATWRGACTASCLSAPCWRRSGRRSASGT